jgi:membrane-bound lytic murein transglycosylase D
MLTRAVRAGAERNRSSFLMAPSLSAPVLGALLFASTAAAGAPTVPPSKPGAHASAAAKRGGAAGNLPVEESSSERRAVRGVAVDDGAESPELNELRRFEEEAFPRTHAEGGDESTGGDAASLGPPQGLPGRWEGSGDVPEVLRTPPAAAARAAPAPPDSEWLRGLALPELPIRWDPQVLRYLDYFRNDPRGRSIMASWLRHAGRYRAIIEAALAREGMPKDLLYVAMIESSFETNARSRVGAGGLWQFMPGAARAYGLEVGYWVDARRDPERSAEAAARYLKDLYVRFNSWPLVFAAYNAGYGAVLKSITRYNTNDYWELCRHEAGLPWESSLYVPKILAVAIVGHNLQAFGFGDIVPDPPFVYEKVDVPPGTTLATVARAARTRPEVLEALNPQISRQRTPPDRGNYAVRVPVGASAAFAEAFERTRGPSDKLETVTLRFGETLDEVARARGTSGRELRRLNGVKDSGELRAGVAIVVPRKKTESKTESKTDAKAQAMRDGDTAVAGAQRDGGGGSADGADEEEVLVAVPDRVFSYEGRERVFYRTRDGDTLDAIADVLAVRADDLVVWNNLDPEAKLHPKMVLQAFVRKDYDPTRVVLLDPAHVRVVTLGSEEFLELEAARRGKKRLIIEARTGDTLAKLGRRYGLTVGDLARINRFSYGTELHDGQRVVVYSPMGEPGRDVAQGMPSASARRDRGGADGLRGTAATTGKPQAKITAKLDRSEGAARAVKVERGERAKVVPGTTASSGARGASRGSASIADRDRKGAAERPQPTRGETRAPVAAKPAPKKK